LRLNLACIFTAEFGRVSRRERKGIQLGLGFIVWNDQMINGAEFLCALCIKISHAFWLDW